MFVPGIIFAQNEQVNNSINLIETDNQQLIAINNQQKKSIFQYNYQVNKQPFDLPQLLQAKSEGIQMKSRPSSSGSSSGVSGKSTHRKTIKLVSLKGVVKHFDKKVKIRHHYKKKNRIKRCASF